MEEETANVHSGAENALYDLKRATATLNDHAVLPEFTSYSMLTAILKKNKAKIIKRGH